MTIDNVADLGNTQQPVVAIYGSDRWMGPAVNVTAGQTEYAGTLTISGFGTDEIGAFKPVWRSDGSSIGYAFGCALLYGIPDHPPVGSWGQTLFNASGVTPCVMAWGPTPSTANQIVYFSNTGDPGIYSTTEYSTTAGTKLISTNSYDHVFGIQYLPDASGFIYTITDNWGDSSNVYRYDFGNATTTKLTNYTNVYARDFSISPDGQTIVFEHAATATMTLYGGASDLWMMGTNGSNAQLFKSNGAHPSWSQGAIPVSFKVYLPLLLR